MLILHKNFKLFLFLLNFSRPNYNNFNKKFFTRFPSPIFASPSVHKIIIEPGLCSLSISSEQNKAGPSAVYPYSLLYSKTFIIFSVVF